VQPKTQSKVRVVYSTLNVKDWIASLPSTEAARPAMCPCCEAAGAPTGERVGLQGHGIRWRPQTGPDAVDGEPFDDEVPTRRYRCLKCGAVIVVLPTGLLPRLRYRPTAVVVALALWARSGLAAAQVRRRVAQKEPASHEAERGWPSLRRWAHRAWDWWGLRRPTEGRGSFEERVEALLQRLASRARDGTTELVEAALQAAQSFDGHSVCATPEVTPTS